MSNPVLDSGRPHLYADAGHRLVAPEVDAGRLREVHYNATAGLKPWLLGIP